MGKSSRTLISKRHLKILKILSELVSIPTFLILVGGTIYNYGQSNMEAKKDREFIERLSEMEDRHRTELEEIENDRDSWREKYYNSINDCKIVLDSVRSFTHESP